MQCLTCGASEGGMLTCDGCVVPYYCTVECRKKDWEDDLEPHKLKCALFARARTAAMADMIAGKRLGLVPRLSAEELRIFLESRGDEGVWGGHLNLAVGNGSVTGVPSSSCRAVWSLPEGSYPADAPLDSVSFAGGMFSPVVSSWEEYYALRQLPRCEADHGVITMVLTYPLTLYQAILHAAREGRIACSPGTTVYVDIAGANVREASACPTYKEVLYLLPGVSFVIRLIGEHVPSWPPVHTTADTRYGTSSLTVDFICGRYQDVLERNERVSVTLDMVLMSNAGLASYPSWIGCIGHLMDLSLTVPVIVTDQQLMSTVAARDLPMFSEPPEDQDAAREIMKRCSPILANPFPSLVDLSLFGATTVALSQHSNNFFFMWTLDELAVRRQQRQSQPMPA